MSRPICLAALLWLLGVLPGTAPAGSPAKDGVGDPLPRGAVARLGSGRMRHPADVLEVFYVAGGKALLSLADDDTLRWWDSVTGAPLRRLRLEGAAGAGFFLNVPAAVSDDGLRILVTDADGLRVLDTDTGKALHRLVGKEFRDDAGLSAWRLSSDGKLLAGWRRDGGGKDLAGPWALAVREVGSGKVVRRLTGDKAMLLTAAAFTSDGKALAVVESPLEGGDSRLRLYDLAEGKEVRNVGLNTQVADGPCRFLQGGKRLVVLSATRESVLILDAATGKLLHQLGVDGVLIGNVTLSRDEKRLLADTDTGAVLWDAESGKQLRKIDLGNPNENPPAVAALSPDGRTLAIGWGRAVRLWDAASGKELAAGATGHTGPVQSLAYSPDGARVLSGAADNTARLWDVKTSHPLHTLAGPQDDGKEMPLSPIDIFQIGHFPVRAVFSPDGGTAAVLWPGRKTRVFDAASGRLLHELGGNGQMLLARAPGGRLVATAGADGLVRVWDPRAGVSVRQLIWEKMSPEEPRPDTMILSLHFSADGRALTASGMVGGKGEPTMLERVWEVSSGRERSVRRGPAVPSGPGRPLGDGLGAMFRAMDEAGSTQQHSPDGRFTVRAGIMALRVLDGAGKELRTLGGEAVAGHTATFSPDGTLLAAGRTDGRVRVWRVATGEVLTDFPAHEGGVSALAFSPDGKHLATGATDTTILIWEVARVLERPAPPAPARLTAKELEAAWAALAGEDAAAAHAALERLASSPAEAVPYLAERLRAVRAPEPGRIEALLAKLNGQRFAERQEATRELERLGSVAAPALRQVLGQKPALEARKRIESLLAKLEGPVTDGELLRSLRAVEALERIGTKEARAVLQTLAGGALGHRLTEDARESLARLDRRASSSPVN